MAAPEGTMVKLFPVHMEPLFTDTVGVMKTETLDTAVLLDTQPAALTPVT